MHSVVPFLSRYPPPESKTLELAESKNKIIVANLDSYKKWLRLRFDSLLGAGHICLSFINKYLEQESMQKGYQENDPVNWLGCNDKMISQLSNSYDCGIFNCLFAQSVSRDVLPDFKQQQVKEICRRISKAIFDGVMS